MKKWLLFLIDLWFLASVQAQLYKVTQKCLPEPYLNSAYSNFGKSVSIEGNYAVVGAPNSLYSKGFAYVLFFNDTTWKIVAKLTSSDAVNLSYFGDAVCISGDVIVIGAYGWGNNTGSAYVFVKPANGWTDMTETARLSASDSYENKYFGCSVGISGNTIVVGAYKDNEKASSAGSAYVFTKPEGGWRSMTETSKLVAPDGMVNAFFGYSVGISDNYIVVGAYGDNASGSYTGATYVFTLSESGRKFSLPAKLIPTDAASFAKFGYAVCISDSIIVASAVGVNNSNGSAYVFIQPDEGWKNMSQTAVLKDFNGKSHSGFGNSLSIAGDSILIGSCSDITGTGAAYIFTKPSSGWVNSYPSEILTAIDANTYSYYGYAVGITQGNIVVCSMGDNKYAPNSGAAYFYRKSSSEWSVIKQTPPTYFNNSGDIFGNSVSVDGNYAVVGSPGYSNSKGCAYVLQYNGFEWNKIAKLYPSDSADFKNFGYSVGISEDNIVVGAYNKEINSTYSGSVYVFTRPQTGWRNMTQTAKLMASEGAVNDHFGSSVAISGNDIVVSAYGANSNKGIVYVYCKPANGWVNTFETAKLKASDGNVYKWFGQSVAVSGETIIAGAPGDSVNGINCGSVYLFSKPLTGWADITETAKLIPSNGAKYDYFGYSLSICGDNIVVGAHARNLYAGYAYYFSKPANGWVNTTETSKLIASDSIKRKFFGYAVSISNSKILIGAYIDGVYHSLQGSVYVFEIPKTGVDRMNESTKLIAADAMSGDYFGNSVAISGDNIIIGAFGDDDLGWSCGSVFTCNAKMLPTHTCKAILQPSSFIYPNPVMDKLFLRDNLNIERIEILNQKGQIIWRENAGNGFIDLSKLTPGIYVMRILKQGKALNFKLVKE